MECFFKSVVASTLLFFSISFSIDSIFSWCSLFKLIEISKHELINFCLVEFLSSNSCLAFSSLIANFSLSSACLLPKSVTLASNFSISLFKVSNFSFKFLFLSNSLSTFVTLKLKFASDCTSWKRNSFFFFWLLPLFFPMVV